MDSPSFNIVRDSASADNRIKYQLTDKGWVFLVNPWSPLEDKRHDLKVLTKAGLLPKQTSVDKIKEALEKRKLGIKINDPDIPWEYLISKRKDYKSRKEIIELLEKVFLNSKYQPPSPKIILSNKYFIKDIDLPFYATMNSDNSAWIIRNSSGQISHKMSYYYFNHLKDVEFKTLKEASQALYYMHDISL